MREEIEGRREKGGDRRQERGERREERRERRQKGGQIREDTGGGVSNVGGVLVSMRPPPEALGVVHDARRGDAHGEDAREEAAQVDFESKV